MFMQLRVWKYVERCTILPPTVENPWKMPPSNTKKNDDANLQVTRQLLFAERIFHTANFELKAIQT